MAEKKTPTDDAPIPPTPAEVAATEQALEVSTQGGAPSTRTPVQMGTGHLAMDEAWRLAKAIAASDMVPKHYRANPAAVLVAIQMGGEVGLSPMAAVQSIKVVNNIPSLWGDGFLAVIVASSVYKDHDEYFLVGGARKDFLLPADLQKDDTAAVCTFWRTDRDRPRTAAFSVAQAKKAGLWTKAGPWTEYPDRMLKMRARGFAGRDGFADVLRGLRLAEEVADLPVVVEDRPQVRRKSETTVIGDPPPAIIEPIRIGPITVARVDQFLDGYTVTLADGTAIDITDPTDALDLEKFKETKRAVVLLCVRDGERLVLQSFAAAE